ncbi:HPr(Ser) kinase/phosphatase [Candidatus Latescibacterota bacterium]
MGLISIGTLLKENHERLRLRLVAGRNGLDNTIISLEINRPGLALAGFIDLFMYNRIQLIGNTELLFLNTLSPQERTEAFEIICQFDLPCIFFTNGKHPPRDLVNICNKNGIPIIITKLTTTQFVHLLSYYLEDIFATATTIHGTLADVYGIGLLFTGRAGIGKSEVSLDLIERGHRLVADDIVHVFRKARGIIFGTGNELTRTLIEIRGVGIVDVQKMFGIRATRLQKRIEIEIQLVDWEESKQVNRAGIEDDISTILDVDIPRVEVPIYPGKYIAVIVESIALNHLLRINGFHAAHDLNQRQKTRMKEKGKRIPR